MALVNVSPAFSDTPYTNEFKENLCSTLQTQMAASVPAYAYYTETNVEKFVKYVYYPLRYYGTKSKQCDFSNETDITFDINVNLKMERWRYKTEFTGQMSCIFSSQYEWFCGYNSISRSESIIEKRVRDAWADPQDGTESYVMSYTDTLWQTDLLTSAENTLSEYY